MPKSLHLFRHLIIKYNKITNKVSAMYLFFSIFFLIVLFFLCLNHRRRKRIIKKICSMCTDEKCSILNNLIQPFGYSYILSQDLFSSRIDAWQREFGYCDLYDRAAVSFHMVFDSLPVYFNYEGKTWLIELWKGQYGINTGCEIGVYYADRILSQNELKHTLFTPVANRDMPGLSFTLTKDKNKIAQLHKRHWWLTAFSMGCFSTPALLSMNAALTFPDIEMTAAFIEGLINAGYARRDICVCCNTVTFSFHMPGKCPGIFRRLRMAFAQLSNRFWCRVYLLVTRPFCLSLDRILYLYYYLPFAFRRTLRIRRYHKFREKKG